MEARHGPWKNGVDDAEEAGRKKRMYAPVARIAMAAAKKDKTNLTACPMV